MHGLGLVDIEMSYDKICSNKEGHSVRFLAFVFIGWSGVVAFAGSPEVGMRESSSRPSLELTSSATQTNLTDEWISALPPLAPKPRIGTAAVWTGRELIVW